MFALFKGIFANATAKEETKILLIGPDGSGKSVGSTDQTFTNQVKSQNQKAFVKREKIKQTMGLNGGIRFT